MKLILFVLIISSIITQGPFKQSSSKKFILDKYNRFIIFHGVNIVYKLPPYLPNTEKFDGQYSLTFNEDIKYLKQLGFNFVRLGIIWEAVEKKEGEYDYNYLNQIKNIIDNLGKNEIYTMIDNHQDMFSRIFCGEGVPYFYANKLNIDKNCNSNYLSKFFNFIGLCKPFKSFNYRLDEKGLPLIEDCVKRPFGDYHFTSDFTSSYLKFYNNENGIQDKFIEFWKVVVKYFKNNEYVIGYDFWNEPFTGGMFQSLKNIIPGRADKKFLLPLYRKLERSLREIDDNYISFFENTFFPDTYPFLGGLTLSGMKEKPSEKFPFVYNTHSYCCNAGLNVCTENGEPKLSDKKLCEKYNKRKILHDLKYAKKMNTSLFLSEFGACSDSNACYNEILSVVKVCEENLVHWAYWNYKPYGDHTTSAIKNVEYEGIFYKNGSLQKIKEEALSRAYVQYYQGEPYYFKYVDENYNMFETKFIYDRYINKNTRIYFNRKLNYENGYVLIVTNENNRRINFDVEEIDENYIEVIIKGVFNRTKLIIRFFSKVSKKNLSNKKQNKNSDL